MFRVGDVQIVAPVFLAPMSGVTDAPFRREADRFGAPAVVEAVKLPVIANGDIDDETSARDAMEQSGAAGVMIGRGAEGRPWRVAQISNALFGTPYREPTQDEKLASMLEQVDRSAALYGERLGVRVVRKHIAAFVDAWWEDHELPAMADVRTSLCRIESSMMLKNALVTALTNRREAA